MNINLQIKNTEDIIYLQKLSEKNLNQILQTAITIGLKSIQMSEVNMDCHSYIDPIKDIVEDKTQENTNYLINISDKLDDLLHIKSNSSRKGKLSEDICRSLLIQKYPAWNFIDVSTSGYEGDCRAFETPIGQILYEFKSYDNNVNRDQINKFIRDMEHTNIQYGIFVSNTSGIVGKKNIEWEIINDKLIIFISNLGLNGYGCILGTELLLALVDINILEKDKHWLLYQNYELEDIIHNISLLVDMLRKNIEMYTKHKQLIVEQRIKINQSIDHLENSSFNSLLELKTTLNTILGTIKNIHCEKNIVHSFDKELFIQKIINQKHKELLDKFIKLCSSYDLNTNQKDIFILQNESIICYTKINKTKIELIFPINTTMINININIKYEKIKDNKIIIELKDDHNIWKLLETKLKI
tara:strand:- start:4149 stop:5387 length:1239 start_codon:yes stop_codon:yes gene_type:complete